MRSLEFQKDSISNGEDHLDPWLRLGFFVEDSQSGISVTPKVEVSSICVEYEIVERNGIQYHPDQ